MTLSPFHRWINWGIEGLNNLSKAIQLVRGETMIQTKQFGPRGPALYQPALCPPLGLPQLTPIPQATVLPAFPPLRVSVSSTRRAGTTSYSLWRLQMPSTREILKICFLNPTERFIGKSPNHWDLCFYLYRILCKLGHRHGVTADSKGTSCL